MTIDIFIAGEGEPPELVCVADDQEDAQVYIDAWNAEEAIYATGYRIFTKPSEQ